MCNEDIREKARIAGIRLWQVADALNMNDGNLSRKLRKELPNDEKSQIFKIIERLKEGS